MLLAAALVVYRRRVAVLKARLAYEMHDVRNVAFGGAAHGHVPEVGAREAVAMAAAVNAPLGSAQEQAAALSRKVDATEL